MRLASNKKALGILIFASVVIIGTSLTYLYKTMGGFDEVEVFRLEGAPRIVVGKYFQGRPTQKELEDLFFECRNQVINHEIDGNLVAITYYHDSIPETHVRKFVGVLLNQDMAQVPSDYEMLVFNPSSIYAVYLTMHPMVRPNGEDLETEILAAANENGDSLMPVVLEVYYPDNSMTLELWSE